MKYIFYIIFKLAPHMLTKYFVLLWNQGISVPFINERKSSYWAKKGMSCSPPSLSCKAKKYKSAESAQQKKNDNNI